MNLFYYKFQTGNFGDDLNLWLWDEVMPGWREACPGHLLVGVGTLINNLLPRGVPKLVMGSGVGYGERIDADLKAECRFIAVRGPRSAAQLGLAPDIAVADPAILVPELTAFRDIPASGRPIFVPHVSSVRRLDWAAACDRAGVDYVSPEGEAQEVIRRIAAAPLVIAESMHAAILADAFRTPWHAIALTPQFNDFKWADWAESLGIALTIHGRPWEGLTSGRAPTGPEGGPSGAALAAAGGMPLRERLRQGLTLIRNMAKARLVARRLAELAALPGQLSETALLEARRAELRRRFAAVLAEG